MAADQSDDTKPDRACSVHVIDLEFIPSDSLLGNRKKSYVFGTEHGANSSRINGAIGYKQTANLPSVKLASSTSSAGFKTSSKRSISSKSFNNSRKSRSEQAYESTRLVNIRKSAPAGAIAKLKLTKISAADVNQTVSFHGGQLGGLSVYVSANDPDNWLTSQRQQQHSTEQTSSTLQTVSNEHKALMTKIMPRLNVTNRKAYAATSEAETGATSDLEVPEVSHEQIVPSKELTSNSRPNKVSDSTTKIHISKEFSKSGPIVEQKTKPEAGQSKRTGTNRKVVAATRNCMTNQSFCTLDTRHGDTKDRAAATTANRYEAFESPITLSLYQ